MGWSTHLWPIYETKCNLKSSSSALSLRSSSSTSTFTCWNPSLSVAQLHKFDGCAGTPAPGEAIGTGARSWDGPGRIEASAEIFLVIYTDKNFRSASKWKRLNIYHNWNAGNFLFARGLKSCLCCRQVFWPHRKAIDPGWNCLGLASKLSKAPQKLHIPRQSWLPKKLKNPYFEYGFVRVKYGVFTGWVRVRKNWVFSKLWVFTG